MVILCETSTAVTMCPTNCMIPGGQLKQRTRYLYDCFTNAPQGKCPHVTFGGKRLRRARNSQEPVLPVHLQPGLRSLNLVVPRTKGTKCPALLIAFLPCPTHMPSLAARTPAGSAKAQSQRCLCISSLLREWRSGIVTSSCLFRNPLLSSS